MPLQIRRGTEAERLAMTTPLAEGELLFVTNDQRIYIGTGTTLGGIPVAGYNDEAAQNVTAALFANGTHGNINFVYDSNTSISATVDLSEYIGVIGADGVRAQILGADNFVFFDGSSNRVVLENIINSDVSPAEQNVYNLGSSTNRFQDLYLNDSVWIGAAQITASGSAINLPAGSTVDGSIIGSGSGDGIIEGSNYRINIVAEDSSLLVDSVNSTFRGNVVSPVTSEVVIDATQKSATLQEIILESPGVISGNPVFLSNLTSIISSVPSLTEPTLAVAVASGTNIGGSLSLTRARGDALNPIIVESGDEIGALEFGAFNGTGFVSVGSLAATVDGTVTFGSPAPIKLDLSMSNGTDIVNVVTFKPAQVQFSAVPIMPNLTTVERDAIDPPELGMIIYNTTDNKFQGYQDVGGSTLQWVNLS
jgi:hypothetical protein